MSTTIASSITKTASQQAYTTIRFLVDRDRVEDAYRAYGYFRWVDNVLDSEIESEGGACERRSFLERQKALLESCYRGEVPRDVNTLEKMLVELVRHDQEKNSGLQLYIRNMMSVMEFDAGRRGRWITQAELNEYTRLLSTAVMECIHYFIGHDSAAPHDETRYLAVSAAHITHMLRDTFDDARLGYYNIPREVLEANHIGPQEVTGEAFRAWVESQVNLAREYFKAGKDYFARVQNPRCRLACLAYTARFEWLLDTFEREGYCLRPQYDERRSLAAGLRMGWLTLSSLMSLRADRLAPRPIPMSPESKA
jgi:phytoene/squalene synthetase